MSKQILRTIFFQKIPYSKWLVRVIILLILLYFCYQFLPQSSFFRSGSHYEQNMKNGNAKSAIYWAKHLMRFRPDDDYYAYLRRGWAYELNQEYEKALHDYNHALLLFDRNNIFQSQYETLNIRFDRYRVYYKLGRKDDAFKGYCSYADDVLLKNSRLKSNGWNDRNLVLGSMRDRIIMNRSTEYMRLTAFVDYQDFMDFMEEEYRKLGSPPEYNEAMQLFRAINNEIIEENLPRSKTSDELDALRNKIREERKQKNK